MISNRPTLSGSGTRETARSVSKLLLAAASLLFVLYLFTLLPGIDRIVPMTPITFAALVGAIATVALVALALYVTPKLATLTRATLEGPAEIVENLASVVYWLGVLTAVLVAHRGLAGAITPLVDGLVWLYDVAFLLLALSAVAFIAARLYVTLDPGADLVADRITDGEATTTGDREGPTVSTSTGDERSDR